MKAIKNLIITLVVVVAILGVVIIGGYIYVRSTYGIDLFRTAGQLKTLTQAVDENALCPNAFGEEDFAAMKTELNKKFDGFVSHEEGKGYNGYSVNFASLAGKSMTDPIFLTEKQVGAIAQTVFFGQTGGKIKLGDKEVSVTVMQVDFSEIAANGSADFNVVAKIDRVGVVDPKGDGSYNITSQSGCVIPSDGKVCIKVDVTGITYDVSKVVNGSVTAK